MHERWFHIGRDSLAAAKELLVSDRHRSSVNRAYFAAFAAVTGALIRNGTTFSEGREAPSHGRLPELIETQLKALGARRQKDLKQLIRALYFERCQADYSAKKRFVPRDVKEMVMYAALVFRILGVAT